MGEVPTRTLAITALVALAVFVLLSTVLVLDTRVGDLEPMPRPTAAPR